MMNTTVRILKVSQEQMRRIMNRTQRQNNALHLVLGGLAETLNDSGLETKAVMSVKEVDVPWTKETVKALLYKPILEAMTGKDSTTEMDTVEPGKVYDVLCRHLSEKLGVVCPPWPHIDDR
jgi:hypothetical protein